ncbi:MAG TPA: histidine phosphatase family protein [Caulobacteraceae bacterium]|jgi:broad specificity phosphatase PhoE
MGARIGAIILARHGRPALSRKVMLSARDYQRWWGEYEVLGLRPDQAAPDSLKALARGASAIVASTRKRSIETAEMVCEGRAYVTDARFIEAPLPPPPSPEWLRLPPVVWGFVSRFTWWWFDLHGNEESRREAERRAEGVASRLEAMAAGGDVLVLAHGFFNAMIERVLKRRGWRLIDSGGYRWFPRYWTAHRLEKRN